MELKNTGFIAIFLIIYLLFISYKIISKTKFKPKIEILNFTFYCSIVFIISLTMFPIKLDPQIYDINKIHNYIPFYSMFDLVQNTSIFISFKNIIGNIVLFIPFSFMLYIKFSNKLTKNILICIGISCSIEIIQILIPFISRSFDVDDIILNTTGSIIGTYLAIYISKRNIKQKKLTQISK
ncbi:VanZ family protein [Bacillus thuringiensis]|uniref:VanZ family protein n=1 Tax=Bacillus TaxID=1386 RepID=UPI0007783DF9|nr:teicoplanin resistance protein VanZ [Bacillus cereus]